MVEPWCWKLWIQSPIHPFWKSSQIYVSHTVKTSCDLLIRKLSISWIKEKLSLWPQSYFAAMYWQTSIASFEIQFDLLNFRILAAESDALRNSRVLWNNNRGLGYGALCNSLKYIQKRRLQQISCFCLVRSSSRFPGFNGLLQASLHRQQWQTVRNPLNWI